MGSKRTFEITVFRAARRIYHIHSQSRAYGTNQKLHYAEIHLLQVIDVHKGIHLTGIAEKLEITKSAVSQNIQRLKKKGMLEKCEDPQKRSKLFFKITPQGKIALQHHSELHKMLDNELENVLQEMEATDEERDFLGRFFTAMDKKLTGIKYNK